MKVKRSTEEGGSRPKLNLAPRTAPVRSESDDKDESGEPQNFPAKKLPNDDVIR